MTHRPRRCHFAHHHPACTCQRYRMRSDLSGLAESIQRWSAGQSRAALVGLPASAVAATLSVGCHGATRDESTVGATRYRSYEMLPDKRPGASVRYYQDAPVPVNGASNSFRATAESRPVEVSAYSEGCDATANVWYASCEKGADQGVQRRRFDEAATAPAMTQASYNMPDEPAHRVQRHSTHGYVEGGRERADASRY